MFRLTLHELPNLGDRGTAEARLLLARIAGDGAGGSGVHGLLLGRDGERCGAHPRGGEDRFHRGAGASGRDARPGPFFSSVISNRKSRISPPFPLAFYSEMKNKCARPRSSSTSVRCLSLFSLPSHYFSLSLPLFSLPSHVSHCSLIGLSFLSLALTRLSLYHFGTRHRVRRAGPGGSALLTSPRLLCGGGQ